MIDAKRNVWLCLLFTCLFTIALWMVELVEGSKITTSEHLDYGLFLILVGAMLGFFIFFLTFFPITLLIERFFNHLSLKLIVFPSLAALGGKWIFGFMYVDWFIEGYNLNVEMAMVIFGLIGLVYGLVDHRLVNNFSNENHSFEA